jgi:Ca-activated chloride channel homolog
MFRFASPWLLALLPAAVAVAWLAARRRVSADAALPLPSASRVRVGSGGVGARIDRARPWLRGVVLALVVVALARPQTGARVESVTSHGVDLVVALDISGSMRAEDLGPLNRLEVARRTVRAFVEGRASDRIGLVSFAATASMRCPLTLDHEMLLGFLDALDFAPPEEDGTAIGLGLAAAVNRLRHSPARSRAVVLVTDGIDTLPEVAAGMSAEAARALGIRVYTVGVGTAGEVVIPVPDGRGGTRRARQRLAVDEPLLREIAALTEGVYFRATDPEGLRSAFEAIDLLETSELESRVRVHFSEIFPWFLAPAAVLMGIEGALVLTRLRRIP